MDVVTLARIQFAMTTIFHYFFVPFSLGTGVVTAIIETFYVLKKKKYYRTMAKFWGQIFLLSFAVGVVTGIIQQFQFGMNWSEYSRFIGDIFGAPLALETLLSFFMESIFLGLWIFTWDLVKPKIHLLFLWLVILGALMSSFWILVANSFMQHPVGYKLYGGHAQLIDFKSIIFNTQLWYQFFHVVAAAITMGGTIIAGLSAFQFLRKKGFVNTLSTNIYKKSMKFGMTIGLIGAISVLIAGDLQMKTLIKDQPMKFAATEGLYKDSDDPASWTIAAWMNEADHKQVFGIHIPYMLSILSYHKPFGSVKGMNSINKELNEKYGVRNYYPPVNALFWSFRIMAGFGLLMTLTNGLGLFLIYKKEKNFYKNRLILSIVASTTFIPFIANSMGWLVTELGRYPWVVYGLFTIEQSISPNVSIISLLISNIVYFTLFIILTFMTVSLVIRELNKDLQSQKSKKTENLFDGGDN